MSIPAAAQLIRLVPQVARRCLMSRSAQIQVLDTTSKCGQYLLPYFHGESEEVVYLLCLDAKCKALDCVLIHRGGVNVASIAARKVVKTALDANATSVVLAHNHPSGLALPSPEDRQTTLVLKAALGAYWLNKLNGLLAFIPFLLQRDIVIHNLLYLIYINRKCRI